MLREPTESKYSMSRERWLAARTDANLDPPTLLLHPDGQLRLLSARDFKTYAALLARWRNGAPNCFFTQFQAQESSTLAWLHDRYLASDELLFLIERDGRPVGHLGLSDFDDEARRAQLGRILLAPGARGSGMMGRAIRTLLTELAYATGIRTVWLEVFADNSSALASYKRAGFRVVCRRNFVRTEAGGMVFWQPVGSSGSHYRPTREVLRLEACPDSWAGATSCSDPSTPPAVEVRFDQGGHVLMDPHEQFAEEVRNNVARLREARELKELGLRFVRDTAPYRYSYNFRWMGRPIIQFPQDLIALQELIWQVRPGAIVETGIAHGGSLIFHASMLQLLGGDGIVVGIDIDIRPHNREAIETHPMSPRIRLVQGSSIDAATLDEVRRLVASRRPVLVILDSNHTHDHVLEELRLYSPLVGSGSYLVVLDTVVEDLPKELYPDRPWGPGNSPKSAVHAFLAENERFVLDDDIDARLLVSVAPSGWLRCVADPADGTNPT